MNILIVDDEKIQIETLRRGLRMRGHTIYEAMDGKTALECIHDPRNRIDLVLADLIMPDMDGNELLRIIRRENRDLPFIMMTAFSKDRDIAITAFKNGCNGYLEKPFTLDALLGEIERVTKASLISFKGNTSNNSSPSLNSGGTR